MFHVPEPLTGEHAGALHHHAVVEEAHEDERDRKLHDSVKGLKEEDSVEPDGELEQEGADLQQVAHDNRDEQRTECLEHVTHHAQPDVFVMRNAHEEGHLENRRLSSSDRQRRLRNGRSNERFRSNLCC